MSFVAFVRDGRFSATVPPRTGLSLAVNSFVVKTFLRSPLITETSTLQEAPGGPGNTPVLALGVEGSDAFGGSPDIRPGDSGGRGADGREVPSGLELAEDPATQPRRIGPTATSRVACTEGAYVYIVLASYNFFQSNMLPRLSYFDGVNCSWSNTKKR